MVTPSRSVTGDAVGNPAATSTVSDGMPKYMPNGGPTTGTPCACAAAIVAWKARLKNSPSASMRTVSRSTAAGAGERMTIWGSVE